MLAQARHMPYTEINKQLSCSNKLFNPFILECLFCSLTINYFYTAISTFSDFWYKNTTNPSLEQKYSFKKKGPFALL